MITNIILIAISTLSCYIYTIIQAKVEDLTRSLSQADKQIATLDRELLQLQASIEIIKKKLELRDKTRGRGYFSYYSSSPSVIFFSALLLLSFLIFGSFVSLVIYSLYHYGDATALYMMEDYLLQPYGSPSPSYSAYSSSSSPRILDSLLGNRRLPIT